MAATARVEVIDGELVQPDTSELLWLAPYHTAYEFDVCRVDAQHDTPRAEMYLVGTRKAKKHDHQYRLLIWPNGPGERWYYRIDDEPAEGGLPTHGAALRRALAILNQRLMVEVLP